MVNVRWIAAVAGAGLLMAGFASAASAQTVTRKPITPVKGVEGSVSFKAYCTPCHGVDGRGTGPAAKALKVPPPDLTQLSARNKGQFPEAAVKQMITGEDTLAAHGSREMPMWGPVFRSVEDRTVVELRVHNLVSYLESIQAKK